MPWYSLQTVNKTHQIYVRQNDYSILFVSLFHRSCCSQEFLYIGGKQNGGNQPGCAQGENYDHSQAAARPLHLQLIRLSKGPCMFLFLPEIQGLWVTGNGIFNA